VEFSDNVNVSTATIFCKPESAEEWRNASILSGRFDIEIPNP
jgi:hypothetical protein